MTIDDQPFRLSDIGLPASMTPREVPHHFRRVHRAVYVSPGLTLGPVETIRAAWLRAGPEAVVGGVSAAVLHGATFFDHGDEVELVRAPTGQGRRRSRVRIVRTDLDPRDIVAVDGMPVTSVIRTAYDLGRRGPAWLGLAHLDDLTRSTNLELGVLWRYVVDHPAVRGIRQIRGLIPWVDPNAESSGESYMRHLVLAQGLPRPETQVKVFDEAGRTVAKFDHAYREEKLAFEFDGFDYHYSDEQRASDARRDRETARLGWHTERRNSVELSNDPFEFLGRLELLLEQRARRRRR
ncbi:hypothetical protein [Williamsia phyllosphaerae]|nr:hypothetical protein [Williamsia phyllosphaerae]